MAEEILRDPAPLADALASSGLPALAHPEHTARVLRAAATTFCDYSVVATREEELRSELAKMPEVMVTVPGFADDVHDMEGLGRIGRYLFTS